MAVSHSDGQSDSAVERDLRDAVARAHHAYQGASLEERETAGIKLLKALRLLGNFLNSGRAGSVPIRVDSGLETDQDDAQIARGE